MKIHEYQGKRILKHFNVPIQDGYILTEIEKASETIKKVQDDFNTKDIVVKAQIHAGGRGAGYFKNNFNKNGGVQVISKKKDVLEIAKMMLGNTLITKQTGKQHNIEHGINASIKKEMSKRALKIK